MNNCVNKLSELLGKEESQLNKKIDENNTPFLFTDLIKSIDYYWLAEYKDKNKYEHFLNCGFPYFLKQFYKTSSFNEPFLPTIPSTPNSLSFCHYYLWKYGKHRFVERYTNLVKTNDVCLSEISENNFEFRASSQSMLELIENQSIDNYFQIMKEYVLKSKIDQQKSQKSRILKSLNREVSIWKNDYIKYGSTPQIDNYYHTEGYIHMVSTQLYDDFKEDFTFGGIPYKHILDVVQSVIGVAIKHIDACLLLCNKKASINLYNILSIPVIIDEISLSYSHYLDIDIEYVKEILNLLVVSKENIEEHLNEDKDFSPPFIQIGPRFVYRSVKGCLGAPILFLQNELKRKYPTDYFNWINEREELFRNQLYLLFKSNNLIKINRNIELNTNGIRTDIDAVIYDKETKSLGLFQLKWQDKYAANLKARRSRISNFYPKAKEWIEKMVRWKSLVDHKEILSALNINDTKISNIYLFVIGRYNTHFSNQEIDDRAAWGSWYHVAELSYKIRTDFNDPIRELYFKLKLDSPLNKKLLDEPIEYKVELDNCSVTYKYG
ncbi:hypothetical protein [Dysgonomonas capnocytophagoides]|uniref:hypothetical protein n=1 Tax=Dysgonomonas capnocytophagoides TaxID=45254 RepID=UPI00334269DC